MIVSCRPCNRSWRYPCGPCRDGFVEYHRTEFGHEVTVHEVQVPQLAAKIWAETVVPAAFPDWMYGKKNIRERRR